MTTVPENTSSVFPSSNKSKIFSIRKRIGWIILGILLSWGIYERTTKLWEYLNFETFKQQELDYYNLFEKKFTEFYDQKFEYFQNTGSVIVRMIEEHEKEQHVDDLLFDLWNIIETSENSIREIILTDNHWNIIFDINNSPSQENPEELKWIITVCKKNGKIESDYYVSLPDLANSPDNKSYITGVHLRQTICWTTRHNNSISAVRRINSKTWLQWFLIIKYRISFFRDFFFTKSNFW